MAFFSCFAPCGCEAGPGGFANCCTGSYDGYPTTTHPVYQASVGFDICQAYFCSSAVLLSGWLFDVDKNFWWVGPHFPAAGVFLLMAFFLTLLFSTFDGLGLGHLLGWIGA